MPEQIFTSYYQENFWGDADSLFGPGSSSNETLRVRESLPDLCKELNIRTFLDVPCDDFAWMRYVALDGVDYTGVVTPLIAQNQERQRPSVLRLLRSDCRAFTARGSRHVQGLPLSPEPR